MLSHRKTHNTQYLFFTPFYLVSTPPALISNCEEVARLSKSEFFVVIGKNFTDFLLRNQFETPYMQVQKNSHLGYLETSDLRPQTLKPKE